MKRLKFIDDPASFSDSSAFVAHLGHVNGEMELYKKLAEKLIFPSYFGENWDALNDCLHDFLWIDQFKIILVHDDRVELDTKDFHIYLEILIDSINDWKEGEAHELEVIFPTRYENLIRPYEEEYLVKLEEFLKREQSDKSSNENRNKYPKCIPRFIMKIIKKRR